MGNATRVTGTEASYADASRRTSASKMFPREAGGTSVSLVAVIGAVVPASPAASWLAAVPASDVSRVREPPRCGAAQTASALAPVSEALRAEERDALFRMLRKGMLLANARTSLRSGDDPAPLSGTNGREADLRQGSASLRFKSCARACTSGPQRLGPAQALCAPTSSYSRATRAKRTHHAPLHGHTAVTGVACAPRENLDCTDNR